MKLFNKSLYLVTDRALSLGRPLTDIVEKAVLGGVSMVQLREKDCPTSEFYQLSIALKQTLKPYNIPLIINDRIDIALACDAEGLHIGQKDMPYQVARKLMGKGKIIGLSIESLEQAELANKLDVDYIGVSPVFSTPTKTDTAQALGIEGLKAIASISEHPIVAIGGINLNNAREIIGNGADAIAVVSAISAADNPQGAAQDLINIIKYL